jgi:hypothetical protein
MHKTSEKVTTMVPVALGTASLPIVMAASLFGMPATNSVSQFELLPTFEPSTRGSSETLGIRSNTDITMAYEKSGYSPASAKFAAYELFGEMRNSTTEERALYEDMLDRISRPIDVNILDL